jgi:dihydropteroate synthase
MGRMERLWHCGHHRIAYGTRTLLVGIVNVTPDSFSDGGLHLDPGAAVARGLRLVEESADVLDVGGESTRPGAEPVSADDEVARVVPVIEQLVAQLPDIPVSVDTRKPEVARAALAAGASIVNDVGAGTSPGMFEVVGEAGAGIVLMHMKGEPGTMQLDPVYDDVVGEVTEFLRERLEAAIFAGIPQEHLCADPGIGFGKNLEHNLALLRATRSMRQALGTPLLIGPSRKGFIGTLTDTPDPADRLEGTAGAVAWCAAQRADLLRIHDVRAMRSVVQVVDAIARAPSSP